MIWQAGRGYLKVAFSVFGEKVFKAEFLLVCLLTEVSATAGSLVFPRFFAKQKSCPCSIAWIVRELAV